MHGQLMNSSETSRSNRSGVGCSDVVGRFQQLMKAYSKSLNELPTFVDQLALKHKQKEMASRNTKKVGYEVDEGLKVG